MPSSLGAILLSNLDWGKCPTNSRNSEKSGPVVTSNEILIFFMCLNWLLSLRHKARHRNETCNYLSI